MKAIRYNLLLELPVLATELQGEPNSAVSTPYLPGSALRGALVACYLREQNRQELDADAHEARGLFLGEKTRYLNAYPLLTGEEHPALPVSEAWRYNKRDSHADHTEERKLYNLSIEDIPTPDNFQEERVGAAFVWIQHDTARLYSPPRQVNVHTQRDAIRGRATEERGAVYRYDALAAGLRLQAVILTEDQYVDTLKHLIEDTTLWIGRARRAGYGQVRVTETQVLEDWHEWSAEAEPIELETGGILQVIFTSDALLRDDDGQPALNPKSALQTYLGVSLPQSTPSSACTRTYRVSSLPSERSAC